MRSTVGQLREFKNSLIYKDMMDELGIWSEDVRNQLEVQSHSFEQLRVLQGNAETLRNCRNMIDIFIESLEGDIEETDKDQLEKDIENEEDE